jgi:hypothetical protein
MFFVDSLQRTEVDQVDREDLQDIIFLNKNGRDPYLETKFEQTHFSHWV